LQDGTTYISVQWAEAKTLAADINRVEKIFRDVAEYIAGYV
jgi:hypothetical protein